MESIDDHERDSSKKRSSCVDRHAHVEWTVSQEGIRAYFSCQHAYHPEYRIDMLRTHAVVACAILHPAGIPGPQSRSKDKRAVLAYKLRVLAFEEVEVDDQSERGSGVKREISLKGQSFRFRKGFRS